MLSFYRNDKPTVQWFGQPIALGGIAAKALKHYPVTLSGARRSRHLGLAQLLQIIFETLLVFKLG
jgi:hypothetical protein